MARRPPASVYQRARSCYLNLSEDSKPAIAKRRNQLKSGRSESLNPVVIVMLSRIHGKPIFILAATLITASSRHDRNVTCPYSQGGVTPCKFPSGRQGQLPKIGWFWAVRIRPRGYGKSSTWGRGCNRGFGQPSHCPLCRAFADPGVGLDLRPRTALTT